MWSHIKQKMILCFSIHLGVFFYKYQARLVYIHWFLIFFIRSKEFFGRLFQKIRNLIHDIVPSIPPFWCVTLSVTISLHASKWIMYYYWQEKRIHFILPENRIFPSEIYIILTAKKNNSSRFLSNKWNPPVYFKEIIPI